jgi:hypothetical protein
MFNDAFQPPDRRSSNLSDFNAEIPTPDPLNDRLIDLDGPLSVRKVQPQGEYHARMNLMIPFDSPSSY